MAANEKNVKAKVPLGPAGEALRRNIKRIREEKRLTFVELSKRLDEIGRPIPVLGLRRIEKGERRVDVDDLMALSQALDTPPVLLLVPLGRATASEVIPGRVEDPWDAVSWLAGRDRSPLADWSQSDVPTQLWEAHDDALTRWVKALEFAVEAMRQGVRPEAADEGMKITQADAAKSLAAIRARIRSLGLTPPLLPEELRHADKPEQGE